MSHFHDLATRYFINGNLDGAMKIAKYLTYTDPLEANTFKIFGLVQQARREYSYAIGAYQRAHLLNCMDADVAFYLAQCYVQIDNLEKALQWLTTCLAIDESRKEAQKLLDALRRRFT